MKKICLLVLLQITVYTLLAQKNELVNLLRPEPVDPMKDKQEFQGFTIRLFPAIRTPGTKGSYSFDILKDNKLVIHQSRNPLPFSPNGIQKKEDAYKIAQWMIQEYAKTGHWQYMVPPHIGRELKIETHSFIQNH